MRRIALERRAEGGLDGARMEADDDCVRVLALPFDRDVAHKHVERRFRCAVAVPSAKPIVRNAAHASRQDGEACPACPWHQRKEMLGDQCRADGVQAVVLHHPFGIKLAQRLFGAFAVLMQYSGRNDNERWRNACLLARFEAACDMLLSSSRSIDGSLWRENARMRFARFRSSSASAAPIPPLRSDNDCAMCCHRCSRKIVQPQFMRATLIAHRRPPTYSRT